MKESIAGTELMLIKVPGKNDKISCESNNKIEEWFKEWNNTWR